MTEPIGQIEVGGICVELVRKNIKHLRLGVLPPNGRVRVSSPLHLDEATIRLAVAARLPWIRRKQGFIANQMRQSPSQMVTGESHFFRGRRYRLNVLERPGRAGVRVTGAGTLELQVPAGSDCTRRQGVLERWYRGELGDAIPGLVATWEPIIGRQVAECRIKRMTTLWGSCNVRARRIWLNLELAEKPPVCLEYVFVHEMVHLIERRHSQRFMRLMDRFLPDWRARRSLLTAQPSVL